MRGRFIVFEGIDGSGKSTCLARVAAALDADGIDVWTTREETLGKTGEWVRTSIAHKMPPIATTFLFLADRATHVDAIKAALDEGRHVLCDRYLHSTLAYQSVTLGDEIPDATAWLKMLHDGWAPMPDHVLLFDADPERSVERTRRRGTTTPYEKLSFLAQVRDAYRTLAVGDACMEVIDAEQPIDALGAAAETKVRTWLS